MPTRLIGKQRSLPAAPGEKGLLHTITGAPVRGRTLLSLPLLNSWWVLRVFLALDQVTNSGIFTCSWVFTPEMTALHRKIF